jgi:hypothetical protein
MTVTNNRKNSSAVIVLNASESLTIAGNNSVSNVAIGDEILTGCNIRTVMWSGTWKVSRGANTLLNLSGSGVMDFTLSDMSLSIDSTATLVANVTGTGTLILKIGKQGGGSSPY